MNDYFINQMLGLPTYFQAVWMARRKGIEAFDDISGGYTTTTSSGGALNPADAQKVDSAEYTLVYHWFQIAIETGVLNQSTGGAANTLPGEAASNMPGPTAMTWAGS